MSRGSRAVSSSVVLSLVVVAGLFVPSVDCFGLQGLAVGSADSQRGRTRCPGAAVTGLLRSSASQNVPCIHIYSTCGVRKDRNSRLALPILKALRGGMDQTMERTLITFDIDGTICVQDESQINVTPNAMHTRAFSFAFKEVFGIEASINEVRLLLTRTSLLRFLIATEWRAENAVGWCPGQVPHQGSTDPLILVKVLLARGYGKEEVVERLDAMKEAM
eukprot:3026210-Rhodomonas_salina.1